MGFNSLFGGGMPGITMQQPQQPPAGANSFNSMFDNSMFSSMFGNMGGNSQPSRQTRDFIMFLSVIWTCSIGCDISRNSHLNHRHQQAIHLLRSAPQPNQLHRRICLECHNSSNNSNLQATPLHHSVLPRKQQRRRRCLAEIPPVYSAMVY